MDPNGKSINPPTVGGVPTAPVINSERVAPLEASPQVPVKQGGTSEETKTIVTVLLIIFMYPVGAIVALFWPKWRWWVKLLVNIPMVFVILTILAAIALVAVSPAEQMKKAQFISECTKTYTQQECSEMYLNDQLRDEPSITVEPMQ